MNTPYGLEIVENCSNCKLKRQECFCNLSTPLLKLFIMISHQTTYPPEATLFVEGQTSRGVFLLCSGKAKLSTSSRDGKVLILKMAGSGRDVGLSAVISGRSTNSQPKPRCHAKSILWRGSPYWNCCSDTEKLGCARRRR